MKTASLQQRLIWTVLGVSGLIYCLSAATFYGLLYMRTYASLQNSLKTQLELVAGMLEVEEGKHQIQMELDEVRIGLYAHKFSGRYFLVLVPGQKPILSGSLDGQVPQFGLNLPATQKPQLLRRQGPLQEPLLVLTQTVNFERRQVTLAVAESLSQSQQWLRRVLFFLLLGVPLVLLVLLLSVAAALKYTLRPLRHLVTALENFEFQHQKELQVSEAEKIWELRELTHAFNGLLQRLQRLRQTETQLLQDVSHQLKTPVTVILSTCDVILRRPREAPVYLEALEQIHAMGTKLRQILQRLLSTAHMDSEQRQHIQIQPLQIESAVQQALEMLLPLAQKKQIALSFLPSDLLPLIEGEELRLLEVLVILLENALAYSPAASEIVIEAGVQKHEVWIRISDGGTGIPTAELPYIFERFFRGRNAQGHEGSGLGLAIARHIMDLHRGRIEVASDLGQGSVFTLFFPEIKG